jgi:DNA-binding CsgD family transcriptional regulator/tetratricopeptide (TPR) repeat protein
VCRSARTSTTSYVEPAAAALGDAFSLVDLATVTGRRAWELVEDLAPAVRGELLRDEGTALALRHQLVHDAIYEDIPHAGRVALHRDAARMLGEAGAPLAQIAAHVMRGASPGDIRSVEWLGAAARDALPRAPDVAVDMLEQVDGVLPVGHQDRDLVTAELVEALLRSGRIDDSAARAEAALSLSGHAEAEASLRLTLVSALSLQNRASDLIGHAEAALNAAPELSDAQRALVLAQSSFGRTFSGDSVGGEAAACTALELAQRSGDIAMTVWGLTTLSFAGKTQGRYEEAVELTERAVRRALETPDDRCRLRHPHFFLGMALCDADRLARLAWRTDAQVPIAQSLGYSAVINARGDRSVALAALAPLSGQMESSSPRYGMEVVAYAAALLAEADRQPLRAYQILRRFWDLDAERQTRRFHRFVAPPLIRLAVGFGHLDVAAAVDLAEAAALAPEVPSLRTTEHRCRGLVARDPRAMTAAVDLAADGPRIIDQVGTCEDAAAVAVSCGRTAEARSFLLTALERCEQLSATAWSARARAGLRDLGVTQGVRGARRRPVTGWASLTDTEKRVAEAVAEGLTNREVAARLYVSPHTVNTHLRHLFQKLGLFFQKLGLSSRAGLTADVVRHRTDVR